jgi:hypothetical protein
MWNCSITPVNAALVIVQPHTCRASSDIPAFTVMTLTLPLTTTIPLQHLLFLARARCDTAPPEAAADRPAGGACAVAAAVEGNSCDNEDPDGDLDRLVSLALAFSPVLLPSHAGLSYILTPEQSLRKVRVLTFCHNKHHFVHSQLSVASAPPHRYVLSMYCPSPRAFCSWRAGRPCKA